MHDKLLFLTVLRFHFMMFGVYALGSGTKFVGTTARKRAQTGSEPVAIGVTSQLARDLDRPCSYRSAAVSCM